MYRVTLGHNFETAHRLSSPHAPKKCQSIHGHSWWVTVTLEGPTLDDQGMLVEFGAFKRAWRAFLDDHVDHHLLTHQDDPVAHAILLAQPDARLLLLPFDPSTEQLARWLHERASLTLAELVAHDQLDAQRARVARVHIQETRVNAAEFEPDPGLADPNTLA